MNTTRKSCPCNFGTPCCPDCSCVTPLSSHGCAMCCGYGSGEQRRARARDLAATKARLAEAEGERDRLREALSRLHEFHGCSCAACDAEGPGVTCDECAAYLVKLNERAAAALARRDGGEGE